MPGILQVGVHLAFQGALQHDLGQPAQQPVRAGQAQPLFPGPLRELAGQPGAEAKQLGRGGIKAVPRATGMQSPYSSRVDAYPASAWTCLCSPYP
jgi:hypothetical protein